MKTERCSLGLVTWNSLLNFDELFEWRCSEGSQVNKGILYVWNILQLKQKSKWEVKKKSWCTPAVWRLGYLYTLELPKTSQGRCEQHHNNSRFSVSIFSHKLCFSWLRTYLEFFFSFPFYSWTLSTLTPTYSSALNYSLGNLSRYLELIKIYYIFLLWTFLFVALFTY